MGARWSDSSSTQSGGETGPPSLYKYQSGVRGLQTDPCYHLNTTLHSSKFFLCTMAAQLMNNTFRGVRVPQQSRSKTVAKSSRAVTKAVATPAFTTTKSDEIFAEAQTLMPGGVSSPVRAFKSVGGGPVVFDRVKGPYAWDVDGNQYVDYVGTWGPAICGHAREEVNDALALAMQKGTCSYYFTVCYQWLWYSVFPLRPMALHYLKNQYLVVHRLLFLPIRLQENRTQCDGRSLHLLGLPMLVKVYMDNELIVQ